MFVLAPQEVEILRVACVISDTMARLSSELAAAPQIVGEPEAIRAAREYRSQATVLGRLLAQLRLPEAGEGEQRPQFRGTRGFYVVGDRRVFNP